MGSLLLRWRIKLEEYDYEVIYVLSQIGSLKGAKETPEENRERVLDKETKATILYEYYDSPIGGHRGMNKTYREIRKKYEWPNMKREIEQYVKRCKSCQLNKTLSPRRLWKSLPQSVDLLRGVH